MSVMSPILSLHNFPSQFRASYFIYTYKLQALSISRCQRKKLSHSIRSIVRTFWRGVSFSKNNLPTRKYFSFVWHFHSSIAQHQRNQPSINRNLCPQARWEFARPRDDGKISPLFRNKKTLLRLCWTKSCKTSQIIASISPYSFIFFAFIHKHVRNRIWMEKVHPDDQFS